MINMFRFSLAFPFGCRVRCEDEGEDEELKCHFPFSKVARCDVMGLWLWLWFGFRYRYRRDSLHWARALLSLADAGMEEAERLVEWVLKGEEEEGLRGEGGGVGMGMGMGMLVSGGKGWEGGRLAREREGQNDNLWCCSKV